MTNYLKNMLDSDDELPSDYEDDLHVPAYLDNKRFSIKEEKQQHQEVLPKENNVDLKSTNNNTYSHSKGFGLDEEKDKNKEFLVKENKVELLSSNHNANKQSRLLDPQKLDIKNKKVVICKGTLNEKDLLCLQCIQLSSNETVLWFFRYLILKNLNSKYDFLKSCLVSDYKNDYSSVDNNIINDHVKVRKYKLIVTK